VNPELIFNIIEARQVDEFGHYTDQRKVSPETWEQFYLEKTAGSDLSQRQVNDPPHQASDPPPVHLNVPSWFRQLSNYLRRDVKSKLNNRQYLMMVLLVSPVLAFILSSIIRYIADTSSNTYIFRENENIPIYIFMALIVVLFLGLVVSAEEIFRDRKILKRERFLHLSRSSFVAKSGTLPFRQSRRSLCTDRQQHSGNQTDDLCYWLALFSTAPARHDRTVISRHLIRRYHLHRHSTGNYPDDGVKGAMSFSKNSIAASRPSTNLIAEVITPGGEALMVPVQGK
jgi:hypothetical protein